MKLLFGLQFVLPKCIESSTGQVLADLDAPWIQYKSPNPSFELICKLQKSDSLIKNSLHYHFCIFRVQHLLLQIFEIFSYCYIWLVQIVVFPVPQYYGFIKQLALRQCYVPFFLNFCSVFCTVICMIWKLFPYELDSVFLLIENAFNRLSVIICIWQIFSYLISVMYSGL